MATFLSCCMHRKHITVGIQQCTNDSVTNDTTLLLAFSTREFISAPVNTTACLKFLLELTRSLQAEAKNTVQAGSDINSFKETMQYVRNNVEKYQSEWIADVEKMCDSVNVEESLA